MRAHTSPGGRGRGPRREAAWKGEGSGTSRNQDGRDAEAPRRRGRQIAHTGPCVERGQRQKDAPERAGERPDVRQRTKIGEMPIASAPATSAAKGAPKPRRAASPPGRSCVIRFRPGAPAGDSAARRRPSIFSPQPSSKGAQMDARLEREIAKAQEAFAPVERIEGALDARRARHLRPRVQRLSAGLRRARACRARRWSVTSPMTSARRG